VTGDANQNIQRGNGLGNNIYLNKNSNSTINTTSTKSNCTLNKFSESSN